MHVFVVTYGRVGKQVTWRNLPPSVQKLASLVVYPEEAKAHGDIPVTVLPDGVRGIGAKRQWVVENHGPKVVMLDDDLRFYKRRGDKPELLEKATPTDLEQMFDAIDSALELVPHVGIASREGANRNTELLIYNTRIMRVLGYRTDVLREHGVRFGRVPVMEDFDVALQLLRAGKQNVILNTWAHNQEGSGLKGGCSSFRTREVQAQAAEKLAQLHPDFVTVVTKTTKGAWGGGERKDVRVQWRKAYGSAK